MNWNLDLGNLNAVWVRLFPRMMGEVWKYKSLSLDIYNDPALFKKVFGKEIGPYLNYTRSVYDYLGVPVPQFMTDVVSHPRFKDLEIDQLKDLAASVKQTCTLPLGGPCKTLVPEIEKLEMLIKAFDVFELDAAALAALEKVSSELFTYWKNNKTDIQAVLNMTEVQYNAEKTRIEALKKFMASGGPYAIAVANAGDDLLLPAGLTATFRKDLCYEYIVSEDALIFPWPERPVNETHVYNMYVVRDTGKSPIVLPGLNTGLFSTPGPGNESAGLGEGFPGISNPDRCRNTQVHLSDLAPKWAIQGSQLQVLAAGIPRAFAEIWGNDLLYDRFILVIREEILSKEAQIIDHLYELANSPGPDEGAGQSFVSWQENIATLEQEIVSIEEDLATSLSRISDLIRNAQNHLESAYNDANTSDADKTTINDCSFSTAKIRFKNLYESRVDVMRVLAEINRLQTECPFSHPAVEAHVEKAKGELEKIINEVVPASRFVSDVRKVEVRAKISAMLRNYIEEHIEFVFPDNVRMAFVQSSPDNTTLSMMHDVATGEGVINVPFPERPNLDEMFRSWSSGESGIPTFTNSQMST